jgi:hypothetical protein
MFLKVVFAFFSFFVIIDCKPSNLDIGNACVAQYLKEKNKLDVDFPIPASLDYSKCRLIMPIIMAAFESALCKKLSEEESIKEECVMREIKRADALEFMLMQEVIVMTKELEEEKMKAKLEEVKEELRNIFEFAAKNCDSDPTYAGLFDDILEIRNESLAVLRQNYCFTKFAIESKLIDVKDIDMNPKKIVTSTIDCKTLIKKNRIEREKKLLVTLKNRNYSEEQVQCVMDKFQIERAFDSNLALEVIDQLDVTLEVRRINRENIAKRFESFVRGLFICNGKTTTNVGDSISIMHF